MGATVLLLNPQPRPVTPTFGQNALLVGLLAGTALGTKYYLSFLVGNLQPVLVSTGDGSAVQFLATGGGATSLVPYEVSSPLVVRATSAGLWLREEHPGWAATLRTLGG